MLIEELEDYLHQQDLVWIDRMGNSRGKEFWEASGYRKAIRDIGTYIYEQKRKEHECEKRECGCNVFYREPLISGTACLTPTTGDQGLTSS